MTDAHPTSPSAKHAIEALSGEWAVLFEELLRGLVHAMNNRITALSAFAELASLDGEPLEVPMLRQEVTRMHSACSLVALLASRRPDAEAIEVRPLLEHALAIHAHHPRMRSVPCSAEEMTVLAPVRVPRWCLLRLMLLLIDMAKRAADAQREPQCYVHLGGDERAVQLQIMTDEPISADLATLVAACDAVVTTGNGELTVELPSLAEVRRRERAAPAN